MISKSIRYAQRGFTLIELLITITIVSILAVALIFALNPTEVLKKARDAQRISDLNLLKTSLIYLQTATSSPSLDDFGGSTMGAVCLTTNANPAVANTVAKIAYSAESVVCTGTQTPGADAEASSAFGPATAWCKSAGANLSNKVDGTGWIPISLKSLSSGSPITNLPVDPVNTVSSPTPAATDLVYRYACQNASPTNKQGYVFEIDAVLESKAYTVDDAKMKKDGGDNDDKYEVGTDVGLLPITGAAF